MKTPLREQWKKARADISQQERSAAAARLKLEVAQCAPLSGHILSYHSFRDELGTEDCNGLLLQQERLVLPRVVDNLLELYQVTSSDQLILNDMGIMEPNPVQCAFVPADGIVLALVPGLAFDASGVRLGYGGGYYDRLLCNLVCPTWGVGFKAQFSVEPLPREEHDTSVTELLLV